MVSPYLGKKSKNIGVNSKYNNQITERNQKIQIGIQILKINSHGYE